MSIEKENIRFTIIIPTKDRAQYLYQTLRTCSNQDYENLEIIVSDDGSTDNTYMIVEQASLLDPRIQYITPGSNVGMLDNFEFALSHVKPGYVIALGGDDGLLPYSIIRMRDILEETEMELLSWPAPLFTYSNAKSKNGQLTMYLKKGKPTSGFRIIDSKSFLERQSRNFSYLSDVESPMIYVKGVVSTKLIEKVRKRSSANRFYSCSTPDGYSGIVLAGEVEKFAFSEEPLSIYGSTLASQGQGYLLGSELAKKHSEDFFKKATHKPLHKELGSQPYSPLISIMTADFLLTARDLPGWPGKFSPINYRVLLSKGLKELENGLFSEDLISRELNILSIIANQNGLTNYFRKKVNKSKRDNRKTIEGNAISPNLLIIDASICGVYNIFDASYFAYHFHYMGSRFNLSSLWKMFVNSVKYRFRSLKKSAKMPDNF